MRLFVRHIIAVFLFLFVFRLAMQAQEHESEKTLPKAVLLSRLSEGDPIPSEAFDKSSLLKVIQNDSSRLINSESRGSYR